ncbi:MAG: BON domain-containing protein [Pirellulales bacterium]|nr:BON domain-containing protein [Pirellulales bacterium]
MTYYARPQPVPRKHFSQSAYSPPASAPRLAVHLTYKAQSANFDSTLERVQLTELVQRRIEARLPGRIRNFSVFATENAVMLTGECSTFYTKQLAQHVAMAVLEYERLINNIEVCTLS